MIVKVANQALKQPMELFIPDKEWEKLEAIENKAELNAKLLKIALRQVSKYGYQIGYCGVHRREVTLKECMQCGINQKGWGKGKDNLVKWETCKHENINYKFAPDKMLVGKIKDQRLVSKMQAETEAKRKADNQTFDVRDTPVRGERELDQQSDDIMRSIRDKENM